MNVEVHINDHLVFSQPVTERDAETIAEVMRDRFIVDILISAGVKAFVCISNVKSKINFDHISTSRLS